MANAAASAGQYRGLRGWIDMVDRLGELKRVRAALPRPHAGFAAIAAALRQ